MICQSLDPCYKGSLLYFISLILHACIHLYQCAMHVLLKYGFSCTDEYTTSSHWCNSVYCRNIPLPLVYREMTDERGYIVLD